MSEKILNCVKFFVLIAVFSSAFQAQAAMLYLDPASGDYGAGDTFVVNIRLDNENECINVADVKTRFPTDLLRVSDFSKGGSILTLWVEEPTIDNTKGIVSFSGGIPAGYCGRIQGDPGLSNILGKIIFEVPPEIKNNAEPKTARVEILPDSRVLLNDGLGSSAKTTVSSAEFSISPSVSVLKSEWLGQLQKDQILPESFKVILQKNNEVFDGKYYLIFSTVDKQSGLDYFEVFEKGNWRRAESPYLLLDQSLLGEIKVRAVDKAGNERFGEYTAENAPPPVKKYSYWLVLLFFLVLLVFIRGLLYYSERGRNKKIP